MKHSYWFQPPRFSPMPRERVVCGGVSSEGDQLRVQKTAVEVVEVQDVDSVVRGQVREGQPVVVAGTALLQDGQAVRLLEDRRR